jgi:hypothetical protein
MACVGVSTYIGCINFAVAPAQTPFWEPRRDEGARLLVDLESACQDMRLP